MKFFDFKSKILHSGFKIRVEKFGQGKHHTVIYEYRSDNILYIISENTSGYYTTFDSTLDLPESLRLKLQELVFEYSQTLIKDRMEVLRFKVKMLPNNSASFLNQDKDDMSLRFDNSVNYANYKTVFTVLEYEELRQYYLQWLPKFDKDDPHFKFIDEDE